MRVTRRALKHFTSTHIGNVDQGDHVTLDEKLSDSLVAAGLLAEEYLDIHESETKPEKKESLETKPEKKKSKETK